MECLRASIVFGPRDAIRLARPRPPERFQTNLDLRDADKYNVVTGRGVLEVALDPMRPVGGMVECARSVCSGSRDVGRGRPCAAESHRLSTLIRMAVGIRNTPANGH